MTVKESVLQALTENEGKYFSGGKLADDLGVSRAAVWKAVKALQEEGYRIDSVTGRGYCLTKERAPLTEEGIRQTLPLRYRDNGIYVYDVIDSTNTRARQIAADPSQVKAPLHGSTVIALQQTAGKGRATAAAVAEAIDAVCGQQERAMIKWVNDVYLEGKKVCGILTEGIMDFESGQIDHLVIGIGVNTNLEGFPEDLLRVAGAVDGDYSRSALAAEIITRVLDYVGDIDARKFMDSYRDRSLLIGRQIRVFKGVYRADPEKDLTGIPATVLGIDEDGGLQVIYTDGSRETLTTGEVTVRL